MRIRSLLVLAALAAVLAVPVAGQAAACNGTITTIGSGATTIYVDDRTNAPPQPGVVSGAGTWVYLEGNNVRGLQTGGGHPVLGDLDEDPCFNHKGVSDILLI